MADHAAIGAAELTRLAGGKWREIVVMDKLFAFIVGSVFALGDLALVRAGEGESGKDMRLATVKEPGTMQSGRNATSVRE